MRVYVTVVRYGLYASICALFLWVSIYNAWLCDDSYISFRIIQNAVDGYGLSWNPGQRIQAFSHPLWMICLYCAQLYGNIFEGTLLLSILLSAGAWLLLFPRTKTNLQSFLIVSPLLLIITSKSVVDFSSSGLETPLAMFLLAWITKRAQQESLSCTWQTHTLCFLLILTRLDLSLLVLPLLGIHLLQYPSKAITNLLPGILLLGSWLLFATIYFGFPFPNTYYAKLYTNYPMSDYILRAQDYYKVQLYYDPITLVCIFWGICTAFVHRNITQQAFALGVLLYCLYIFRIGGDFMMGRFFALPCFLSATIIIHHIQYNKKVPSTILALVPIGISLFYLQFPTVRTSFSELDITHKSHGFLLRNINDERRGYYAQSGLLSSTRKWPQKHASGYSEYPIVRCLGLGRLGLKTTASQYIIDYCALTDPFLARIPAAEDRDWEIGHLRRYIPRDYLDSISLKTNQFSDREMALLWEDISLATTKDIFTPRRWDAIWRLNTYSYQIPIEALSSGPDFLQYPNQNQESIYTEF